MTLATAPFPLEGRRAVLLTDGDFSSVESKTAVCYLMYRAGDCAAVVNRERAGARAGDVIGIGFGGNVPVVATVEEALAFAPEFAVVGTAPMGGQLEGEIRRDVMACVAAGLDVVSGLHAFLSEDPDVCTAARASGSRVWDVRRVPELETVSTGRGCETGARTVMIVGSDCNVGKMTVAVELSAAARARGLRADWAATGQTGIMLKGRGIAVDRVISDFVGGAAETLVNEEGRDCDVLFVEGQGALVHPGYAGVTLGLLYGVMPDCLVMAHVAHRQLLKRLDTPVPSLVELIDLHHRIMRPLKSSPVVAVALNTGGLDEGKARDSMRRVASAVGLPVGDVIRFGCDDILDAVLNRLGLTPGKDQA